MAQQVWGLFDFVTLFGIVIFCLRIIIIMKLESLELGRSPCLICLIIQGEPTTLGLNYDFLFQKLLKKMIFLKCLELVGSPCYSTLKIQGDQISFEVPKELYSYNFYFGTLYEVLNFCSKITFQKNVKLNGLERVGSPCISLSLVCAFKCQFSMNSHE